MNVGQTSVYRYFDAAGALLYVGITCRGTKRMSEHASSKVWWTRSASCTVEHYPTRELALGREAYLIWKLQPPFNTQGKKAKSAAYVGPPEVAATASRIGPCETCGAHEPLSRSRGLCRSCSGRVGVLKTPGYAPKHPGSAPRVGACPVCETEARLSRVRGLCRSCEGKAGALIQKLKESA